MKLSNTGRSEAADAVVALADNGYLRIYDGTQPANPQTAVSGQNLLAELRFGTPAFGAASNGVATANSITGDSSANASGTATWCRILQSDGSTVLWDGTVGTSDADLILNGVAIVAGGTVNVSSLTYTQPESEA